MRRGAPSPARHEPAPPTRPPLGSPQRLSDEFTFGLGVGQPIVGEPGCELELQRCVGIPRFVVGAQIVAEQKVFPLPGAADGAHVDVDVASTPRRRTEVAMLGVAGAERHPEVPDGRHITLLVFGVYDAHLYVDDRFGGEPGYGGRSDVVDAHGEIAQGCGEAPFPFSEHDRPRRVIGDDHDVVAPFLAEDFESFPAMPVEVEHGASPGVSRQRCDRLAARGSLECQAVVQAGGVAFCSQEPRKRSFSVEVVHRLVPGGEQSTFQALLHGCIVPRGDHIPQPVPRPTVKGGTLGTERDHVTTFDGVKEFARLERVLAIVCAFTPLVLIIFDGGDIRESISAYYAMDQNQWFYYLLTVASMLFLVNGVIKEQNYYNVVLGVLLAGVILFNEDDWTAIHVIFAAAFFGGNAIVILLLSRGAARIRGTFIAIGLAMLAASLAFRLSLFWIEWLSLAVIAAHYLLDSLWGVDYRAIARGEPIVEGMSAPKRGGEDPKRSR